MTIASRAAAALAVAAALLGPAPFSAAAVVYDNLASSRDGSDPLYSYGPLADSFTTDANGSFVVTGVDALLRNGSAAIVGTVQLSLRADAGNAPGAELAALGSMSTADVSTASFSAVRFVPAAAYALAAGTTYWIELSSAGPNAVEWSWTNDLGAFGVAGQSNYSATLGTNANAAFGPYQMAVDVAAVPEPGSVALIFTGLAIAMSTMRRRRGR